MMKKLTLGLSLAALAVSGAGAAAYAQQNAAPPAKTRPTMDTNGDGVITRAEAQAHAAQAFARMDANKDGKLDQADREARRTAMRDERFAKLDTNKDGSISKDEFTAAPARGGPGKPDGMRDGRKGGHHGGRHGMGMGKGMMGGKMDADADKNGSISQAEFTAAALKRFDAMDANKDGKVTAEEQQAARAQMKAKWKEQRAAPKAAN